MNEDIQTLEEKLHSTSEVAVHSYNVSTNKETRDPNQVTALLEKIDDSIGGQGTEGAATLVRMFPAGWRRKKQDAED
ncbi:hypothetical protein NFI96_028930 [Prochilodus magdalenae]|nr:hypothetical protein NFI96_028930 [Prochilodus magdalenae]